MTLSSRKTTIQKAREYLAVRPVFLDTETTGLDPSGEIIEICVIDYDGAILLDKLVRPRRTIPMDAIKIHGITNDLVRNEPSWPEIWPQVEMIIKGRYVGIYNADFDLRMMKQSHQAHGMLWEFAENRVFDVMRMYAAYNGISRWVSLEIAGRQCGIQIPNAHRARADTQLLRAIFLHIASRIP